MQRGMLDNKYRTTEDTCWRTRKSHCFIIIAGMYDVMPGNFWFGKKWYHIKYDEVPPKCPDHLTENNKRFINQVGYLVPTDISHRNWHP